MYSSVNNHDTSSSILSIKEIVGIVVVFSFLLYLLFPKSNIDTLLEGKGENTNLSINYLESMLLYYPDSIKLQMILIRNYKEAGESIKALELVNKLLHTVKDKKRLSQLYRWEYLLLKDQYFLHENPKLLARLKEKLYAYYQFVPEPKEYMFFFPEAAQIDFPKLQYIALKGLMKEQPELVDYKFEKELFFLASSLGEQEESYHSILRLLAYPEVERKIKELAIPYLLAYQDYPKASSIAHWLFLHAKDNKERQQYFGIALNTLISDKHRDPKQIEQLIHAYQSDTTMTGEDIHTILTLLLAMGETQTAAHFAIDSFDQHANDFNQTVSDLAIKSLIYNQQLQDALTISSFAQKKFSSPKWLDQSIQLAQWLGDTQKVVKLYTQGYHDYPHDPKYEAYLLKTSTLNNAYKILGEIYQNRIDKHDYTMVTKLADYFEYTGEIDKAEEYFTHLHHVHSNKKIDYYAIDFAYKNEHFKKGLLLYQDYKKRYGMDKILQQRSIQKLTALKEHHQAYLLSKELKEVNKKIVDRAWIEKDYPYLYTILWKLEQANQLQGYYYSTLITLEKEINHGKKLGYLYRRAWQKNHIPSYLYALLYHHMEQQAYPKIQALLDTLLDKASWEKRLPYQIFMANYYAQIGHKDQALNAFEHAFALDPNRANTHQAYLWFLLDHHLSTPLVKEISYLRKHPSLQQEVGFASVVGALQLQKSDLALRWLTPLLHASNKLEYQVVYADILELQDRMEGAKNIRLSLFRRLDKMIDTNPQLLEEKAFARLYLQLAFRYATPVEKRANYLRKFKTLFSPEEYQELEVGYHSFMQNPDQVHFLASKYHLDLPWLNLYLAMSLNNQQQKQKLLHQEGVRLAIRDRVIASLEIGNRADAYTFAFQGLEENSHDVALYRLYHDMIQSDAPRGSGTVHYQHLNQNFSLKSQELSYRWRLFRGIFMKLSSKHEAYTQQNEDKLALTLSNRYEDFLWETSIEGHHTEKDFIATKMMLSYKHKPFSIALHANYHTQSTQSPKLQAQGMESYGRISLTQALSPRFQITTQYQQTHYKLHNRRPIGSSQSTQLSLNYLLRAGYPDLRFNGYLSHHEYERFVENFLPKNFNELGGAIRIGETQSRGRYQGWRPFGSMGLAINNHHDIGTSFALGINGSLKGDDTLRLLLNYSRGIEMISEPSYGIEMEYQF